MSTSDSSDGYTSPSVIEPIVDNTSINSGYSYSSISDEKSITSINGQEQQLQEEREGEGERDESSYWQQDNCNMPDTLIEVLADDTKNFMQYIHQHMPDDRNAVLSVLYYMIVGVLPIILWLPRYSLRKSLVWDVLAGLTHGVMVIPQGMAYAVIAGLHPVYGLYCAFVPPLMYVLFGSSIHLVVGPTAVLSLMTSSAASNLYKEGTDEYVSAVLMIAFWAGVLDLLLGLARIGFLADLLSHSLISGFTSAAGILIACSQLHSLLGIDVKRNDVVYRILIELGQHITEIHGWTTLMGVSTLILLYFLKSNKWTRWIPGPLLVVVIATLLSWSFRLDKKGVDIVGHVPKGLPGPQWEAFATHKIGEVIPDVVVIALVGFIEAISVGRTFAIVFGYEVNANQELIALGISNIVGSLFTSYPATGSFSRTAVNARAGARSPLTNVVGSVLVMVSLLFLTQLFHYLPKTVLAAIIIAAVLGLVNVREPLFLLRCKKLDLVVLLVAFIATLTLGIKLGIVVALVTQLFLVMLESARPHCPMRNIEEYCSMQQYGEYGEVLILKFEENLFFMNSTFLKEKVRHYCKKYKASTPSIKEEDVAMDSPTTLVPSLRTLIIDGSSINKIDSSGIHAIVELYNELQSNSVTLYISSLKRDVLNVLLKSGCFNNKPLLFPPSISYALELHNENNILIEEFYDSNTYQQIN